MSYPVNRRQDKGGGLKSVAGRESLAPHASHLDLSIQILTGNSGDFNLICTDALISNEAASCVVLHIFLYKSAFAQ